MLSSSIKILQVNLNRSAPATESTLQVAIELNVDLVVVQEPWVIPIGQDPDYTNTRSVLHSSFTQILPKDCRLRPRTLVYVSRSFRPLVSLANSSPQDPDMQVIDITEGNAKIQLLNIYNEADQLGHGPNTLARCLYSQTLYSKSVILGDFNTHHPWWDPLAHTTPGADQLVDWLEQQDLALLNTPGTGTFFRPNLARESVLDLTFATSAIASKIQDWQVLPDLGSDHYGLLFTVLGTSVELVDNPTDQAHFNTQLANWDLFATSLKSYIAASSILNSQEFNSILPTSENILSMLEEQNTPFSDLLDKAASEFTQAIFEAATASIPRIKPGARPKPWWSPELKALRKTMLREQRGLARNPDSKLPYLQAKNIYFLAIKRAKRDHWNHFLEREDSKTIFKAMSYTKDRRVERIPHIRSTTSPESLEESFEGKCSAFRNTLFPPPPTAPRPSWDNYRPLSDWKWPTLSKVELENACSAKIKGKTPGPDSITQEIILQAYTAVPDVFYKLYSSLLDLGYHPSCWKQATGAILKKPGKPDYAAPKAYRVISLLNCLGKVSERILAQRLGHLAETTTLLHPTQIGGRLKKSAIDAALLLTNEVEANRRLKHKTTTMFLDVKGAFDHVAKNQLLALLQRLRLPTSLIAWISSFMSNRLLRLSFDGQIEGFCAVDTGIPQGSPISPILFLIYIRELFPSQAVKFLSYIDDISLTVSSTSLKKNVKILEREVAKIYDLGAKNAIQFDLDKTELLHFTTSKEAKTATLNLPNGEVIESKEVVRWLGVWFDPGLTFKQHVATRTSQARSAFQRMARLANTERGLSPCALRQLYLACVTSIADYGSIIWWRGQTQFRKPLQALQNLGVRKILGVFRTAPTIPMEVEAALLPPHIRLNNSIRQYAFRILKLSPNHLIRKEIAQLELSSQEIAHERPAIARRIQSQPTQLERIRDSIQRLVDLESLEQIQHFKYSPWDRNTPYTVEINPLPKEEAAIAHNTTILQHWGKDIVSIYTDASSTSDRTGIGVGLVAKDYSHGDGQTIYKSMSNLGGSQLVYNGELEGVTQAVEYASQIAQPGQHFQIHSDNQAGLYRLRTPSDNPGQACQIRTIEASQSIVDKGATIALNWVPGHTDVAGNEAADSLAKEATKLDSDSDETSFALLGQKIKQTSSVEWKEMLSEYERKLHSNPATYSKKYAWRLASKIQLPLGTKRELASSFYQLKIGHGYFKSYMYRLNHTENAKCKCGQRETPEHLLLSCTELKEARRRLRDEMEGIPLSLPTLLHTKLGIEKTMGFLKDTRIATRRWHLERRAEERNGSEEEDGVEED